MPTQFSEFLINWGIMSASLWVASFLFRGLKFDNHSALLISALVLGFVNAVVKPILFLLTFPLTIVTLGLFYLALNAFMIQLVAKLVKGFSVSGFWTALFVSIFIAFFASFLESFFPGTTTILISKGNTISV
ncbi:MAG TPA: phage holin family protein [Methylophilaceae bacterium]|jgi:putative membrane protein